MTTPETFMLLASSQWHQLPLCLYEKANIHFTNTSIGVFLTLGGVP